MIMRIWCSVVLVILWRPERLITVLEVTATEVWKLKTDSTTELVHWAVRPKPAANMTFRDLTHHWNCPQLPILEWEKSQATKRLSDEHVVYLIPMRKKELEEAGNALKAYDGVKDGPGKAVDQLSWLPCYMEAAAEFTKSTASSFLQ